jgi:hypothetical protein
MIAVMMSATATAIAVVVAFASQAGGRWARDDVRDHRHEHCALPHVAAPPPTAQNVGPPPACSVQCQSTCDAQPGLSLVDSPPATPQSPADVIRKIDETHYEVHRAALQAALASGERMGCRVVPSVGSGRPNGFKLYAIRPGSWTALLGFHNGDRIGTANEIPLDSAETALTAYASLKTASVIRIALVRDGQPNR